MENKELLTKSENVYNEAKDVLVIDKTSAELASIMMKSIDVLLKEIDDFCDPNIKRWHEGHKQALADKKKYYDLPQQAKKLLSKRIAEFQYNERKRVEEENRKREEELRKQEEERQLALAEELEIDGRTAEAQEIIDRPIITPVIKEEAPKINGVKIRDNWKFKIIDVNLIPKEYLIPDEKLIGQIVRRDKDKTNIQGIKVYNDPTAF